MRHDEVVGQGKDVTNSGMCVNCRRKGWLMIGFYLTINNNTEGGIKLVSSAYESLTNLDSPQQQGLYIFEDDRLQTVQSNGYTVFNIGTLIYKNAWQNKALELIMHDLNNGRSIQEIISNTRGQFCLIVHIARDVFVITDKLGSFPVFIFKDDETVQISNILLLLAKNNNVSINHQAFAEYLSFDYCFGHTLFNEIEPLSMATIYQFGGEQEAQVYDDPFSDIHFNRYTDLYEIAGIAKETLADNLSFLSSHDRIFVDITGGFDTRLVATLLYKDNIDFEAGICGEQVYGESELADRVAQTLGVTLHSDIKITDRHLFKEILDQHFMINTGVPILYHSSELINYYEHIKRECDIHLTGFGGSELMEQTMPKMRIISSKVNKRGIFMHKEWVYKDIFVDHFSTEADFYCNLTDKLDRLLQKLNSGLYNEVANAVSVLDFSRNFAGRLIGTHNVILPAYSPFLEANYVRLMLQTSYELKKYHRVHRAILTELNPTVSSIMTSHGYSATFDSQRGPSVLRRFRDGCKNLARQTIYGFRLFGVMKV
ncbi:MAG: hypothetical protein KAV87_48895, partial [Desulfobacteraceae bacterium]|nr:hypothetical protein [Desulfobacteraceae bacterium]